MNKWTEFELLHEYDKPIFSSQDVHSIANIGEVMPDAISALTASIVLKEFDSCIATTLGEQQYIPGVLSTTQYHGMLDVTKVCLFHQTRLVYFPSLII